MKKILFCASTLSHIENFHIPYLKYFKEKGFEVHIAGKENNKKNIPYVDKVIPINFEKSMISLKNLILIFKIAHMIRKENYSIINLHTILASFFTRLGVIFSCKKHPLVINTVHGYLFDENSSLFKKIIMICAEKIVCHITDVIIVMNTTDYNIAKKYHLYLKNLYLINGMGFNPSKFLPGTDDIKYKLRKKYDFSPNDFILVYAAEFSNRKNQIFLIHALKELVSSGYSNIKLILLGEGDLYTNITGIIKKHNLSRNIFCPGYANNTYDYYHLSDVCVSSSRIEGLPFNIMEAMSCGLPIIASKIKGHIDLVVPDKNGFLFEYDNNKEFCHYVLKLYNNKNIINCMKKYSIKLSSKYTLTSVYTSITNIFDTEISTLNIYEIVT